MTECVISKHSSVTKHSKIKFVESSLQQILKLLVSLWLVLYAKVFVYLFFSLCKTYNCLALLSSFLLISPFAHLVQSHHFVTRYLAFEATFVKKAHSLFAIFVFLNLCILHTSHSFLPTSFLSFSFVSLQKGKASHQS